MPGDIWPVIELGRDIMPTNIVTKFDEDRIKTVGGVGILRNVDRHRHTDNIDQ